MNESGLKLQLLDAAKRVPAYAAFLAEHDIDAAKLRSDEDFDRLPLTTKDNYVRRYPVSERCLDGRLTGCDTAAVSSGSTGEPTFWPRSQVDEAVVAERFDQILRDSFQAHLKSTLAVVCFPMGTWVGGMYTASCLRRIAAGLPMMTLTPGNKPDEIARVVNALGPSFDQIVLLGYPPFVRDAIDIGETQFRVDWRRVPVRFIFAGEVFSEAWRDLICARVGGADPVLDTASLYGTADGGVLGNETPLSITVRRWLAARPDLARQLFGESRLPTLGQYDPAARRFETAPDGTLLFSAFGAHPLFRYHIADSGGLIGYDRMLAVCRDNGFDPQADLAKSAATVRDMPFVYVFGRTLFAVSFYGANIYPENVAAGLEQQGVCEKLSGKFVLDIIEIGPRMDKTLRLIVEAARGMSPESVDTAQVAESVRTHLMRLNSEFANYAPRERQTPAVQVLPHGHPQEFPVGVKHRYTR